MAEENVVGKDGRNPLAEMLMDTFQWSYEQQESDFERLMELKNTHDNVVDDDIWPTISQIPIAQAWATVEKSLGPAMEYLFPPQPFVKLLPKKKMDPDALRNLEWAMHLMMVHRMKLKKEMHRSVKDCFKVGVGYGIVEPISVTPTTVFDIVAGENSTQQVGVGSPVRSIAYRYLSTGKVVPYPSGTDFNGRDRTPFSFALDLYPQWQFENMYEALARENTALDKNPEAIINEARTKGFTSKTAIAELADIMAGRSQRLTTGNSSNLNVPINIPVLKCYQEGRHTWLFCGSKPQVLFDKGDTLDTLRCPLIKLDAWLDGDRWFGMSQPEADSRLVWAKNIWFNLLYDLATWSVKRPLVFDSTSQEDPPDFGPTGVAGLPGDARATARFLDPPGIDTGSIEMGRQINSIHEDMTGQKDMTDKNFTRGGSMAFQDLMSDTGKRDRLRYSLLQMGGLESVAEQVLVYMQTMGDEMDLTFEDRKYDQNSGDDYIEYYSITSEDVKNRFNIVLDLDSKHRRGAMDMQNIFPMYDRMIKSEAFDDWEAARYLVPDEIDAQRLVLPREVVREKQAAREAAERQALLQQGQGQPGPEPTVGEQAMAGAAMGGAL